MSVFTGVQLRASDGNEYRFMGTQWLRVTNGGKTSQVARASVAMELDRLAAAGNYVTQSSVFDNLLLRGVREGWIPARTQTARDWFRNIAKDQTEVQGRDLLTEKTRMVSAPVVGRMYFFQYDPKYKNELPYYDTFPLIFPIEKVKDGFIGLNFHYLPLQLRAKLMDALYSIKNNRRFDETTILRVSYSTLKSAAKFKYFKPTVHKYLSGHVRSKFIEVYSSEWDIGLFLPVAQFKKASAQKVWKESQNKV